MAEPAVVDVAGWDFRISFWFVWKKLANVIRNENYLGVKEDKQPGCKGELEFSWMEFMRFLRLKY